MKKLTIRFWGVLLMVFALGNISIVYGDEIKEEKVQLKLTYSNILEKEGRTETLTEEIMKLEHPEEHPYYEYTAEAAGVPEDSEDYWILITQDENHQRKAFPNKLYCTDTYDSEKDKPHMTKFNGPVFWIDSETGELSLPRINVAPFTAHSEPKEP